MSQSRLSKRARACLQRREVRLRRERSDAAGSSAVAYRPVPDSFVNQSVDNDIRCDGTDAQNYAPFAATLWRTLEFINQKPRKRIVSCVSQWATVKSYTNAIKHRGRCEQRFGEPRQRFHGSD